MSIFRIRVCRQGVASFAYIGLFADIHEATSQAGADWPEARKIEIKPVINLTGSTT